MSEEKKKGGFWASLFGRNKKQEEQKIETIIEASSVEMCIRDRVYYHQ